MNGDCLSEPLLLSLISKLWSLSYKLLLLFTGTKILYNIVLYKAWKETWTFSIETQFSSLIFLFHFPISLKQFKSQTTMFSLMNLVRLILKAPEVFILKKELT